MDRLSRYTVDVVFSCRLSSWILWRRFSSTWQRQSAVNTKHQLASPILFLFHTSPIAHSKHQFMAFQPLLNPVNMLDPILIHSGFAQKCWHACIYVCAHACVHRSAHLSLCCQNCTLKRIWKNSQPTRSVASLLWSSGIRKVVEKVPGSSLGTKWAGDVYKSSCSLAPLPPPPTFFSLTVQWMRWGCLDIWNGVPKTTFFSLTVQWMRWGCLDIWNGVPRTYGVYLEHCEADGFVDGAIFVPSTLLHQLYHELVIILHIKCVLHTQHTAVSASSATHFCIFNLSSSFTSNSYCTPDRTLLELHQPHTSVSAVSSTCRHPPHQIQTAHPTHHC